LPTMLARKVSKAKWESFIGVDDSAITADAVTCDLRTTNNDLSVWHIEEFTDAELHEAVLAIVSCQERLDSFDLAALDEEEIVARGLKVEKTEGGARTPVDDLHERHHDIRCLTYDDLRPLAEAVISSFRRNQVKRITAGKILDIVVEAIRAGRLELCNLRKEIREGATKRLERT